MSSICVHHVSTTSQVAAATCVEWVLPTSDLARIMDERTRPTLVDKRVLLFQIESGSPSTSLG
jgi:uncharacterized membrane protein